jgi:hypothetical protein
MIIEVHEVEWGFSPWQRRQGLEVIIETILVKPIQPRRWAAMEARFVEAIETRGETLNTIQRETIKAVTHTNLSLVSYAELPRITLDPYGEPMPGALDTWAHALRTQVNELVTVDLLGPAWRPRRPPVRRPSVHTAERLAALEVDRLLARRDLTHDERALIEAMIASDGIVADAAFRLGWRQDLTRQRLARLRKKLLAS